MSLIIKRSQSWHWTRALIVSAMLITGAWQFVEVILNFSTAWYWLILATYYTITVNETFTHRACQHKMFDLDVNSVWYKIMTWLSSVDQSHGPVRTGTLWHLSHHKYSDQGDHDNVNSRLFWFGDAWVLPFAFLGPRPNIPDARELVDRAYRTHQEVIDDPWTKFCEKYSLEISVSTMTVLFLLFPVFLFKILLMGRFIMTLGMIGAGIAHRDGVPLTYRNFNTPDSTNNNLILHYLFFGIFGGLLQNNHHGRPRVLNMGIKWWEIDASAPMAYLFKFLMSKK